MFFIFPFEMLMWVIGVFVLFFLFILFPLPMVIITILIIWVIVNSTKQGREEDG